MKSWAEFGWVSRTELSHKWRNVEHCRLERTGRRKMHHPTAGSKPSVSLICFYYLHNLVDYDNEKRWKANVRKRWNEAVVWDRHKHIGSICVESRAAGSCHYNVYLDLQLVWLSPVSNWAVSTERGLSLSSAQVCWVDDTSGKSACGTFAWKGQKNKRE